MGCTPTKLLIRKTFFINSSIMQNQQKMLKTVPSLPVRLQNNSEIVCYEFWAFLLIYFNYNVNRVWYNIAIQTFVQLFTAVLEIIIFPLMQMLEKVNLSCLSQRPHYRNSFKTFCTDYLEGVEDFRKWKGDNWMQCKCTVLDRRHWGVLGSWNCIK